MFELVTEQGNSYAETSLAKNEEKKPAHGQRSGGYEYGYNEEQTM